MDQTKFKLADFFSDSDFKTKGLSAISLREVQKKIKESYTGSKLPGGYMEKILTRFRDLLDIDIRSILLTAWNKSMNFSQYLDSDRFPRGQQSVVPLNDHRITSEHTPYLQPYFNNIPLGEIRFLIHLELALKGVVLKIQDRHIRGISIDSCVGDCQIESNNVLLLKKNGVHFINQANLSFSRELPLGNLEQALNQFRSDAVSEENMIGLQ